jgi:hypothetical protein
MTDVPELIPQEMAVARGSIAARFGAEIPFRPRSRRLERQSRPEKMHRRPVYRFLEGFDVWQPTPARGMVLE